MALHQGQCYVIQITQYIEWPNFPFRLLLSLASTQSMRCGHDEGRTDFYEPFQFRGSTLKMREGYMCFAASGIF